MRFHLSLLVSCPCTVDAVFASRSAPTPTEEHAKTHLEEDDYVEMDLDVLCTGFDLLTSAPSDSRPSGTPPTDSCLMVPDHCHRAGTVSEVSDDDDLVEMDFDKLCESGVQPADIKFATRGRVPAALQCFAGATCVVDALYALWSSILEVHDLVYG